MGSRFCNKPIKEKVVDKYQSTANPPIKVPLGPPLISKKIIIYPIKVSSVNTINDIQSTNTYLITEDGKILITEDGKILIME